MRNIISTSYYNSSLRFCPFMAVIYTVNSANFRKSFYIVQRNSGQFNPFIVRFGREQQLHLKTTTKKFLDFKIPFQRRFLLKPLRHPQLSSRDCRISTIGIPMNSRLVGKMRPTHKLKGREMLEATDVLEKMKSIVYLKKSKVRMHLELEYKKNIWFSKIRMHIGLVEKMMPIVRMERLQVDSSPCR